MEEVSNKKVLEEIAKDILKAKSEEEIETFVKKMLYSSLLNC
ncbi:MAG: hypothetical protein ACOWWH_11385 [Eubacteriaceae bacterium]